MRENCSYSRYQIIKIRVTGRDMIGLKRKAQKLQQNHLPMSHLKFGEIPHYYFLVRNTSCAKILHGHFLCDCDATLTVCTLVIIIKFDFVRLVTVLILYGCQLFEVSLKLISFSIYNNQIVTIHWYLAAVPVF